MPQERAYQRFKILNRVIIGISAQMRIFIYLRIVT